MKKFNLSFEVEQILLPHVVRYLDELQEIKGLSPVSREQARKEARELIDHPQINWYLRFKRDAKEYHTPGEFMCFLAIGFRDNCHPACDYFISQTYVAPQFRRQGIMTDFAGSWIKQHEGRYCLFIIDRNKPALAFWKKLFTSLNYKPQLLTQVTEDDGYTTQYGWRPR